MTLKNSNWDGKTTVMKGGIGERLVNEYLIKNDFIPYSPDASGAHPFDRLVASRDKRTIFIADSKAKSRRKFYPDTGIDIRHYSEYKHIQDKYNIDVFIFFIDEESGTIYGNILRKLDSEKSIIHNGRTLEYPMEQGGIRYFSIESMKHVANIPKAEKEAMQALTTKQEVYR